jgi:hypothetical protein
MREPWFVILAMEASVEAIFLSTFVLIRGCAKRVTLLATGRSP